MNIGIVTTWFERGASYVSKAFRDELVRKHDVYIYARGGERGARGNSKWDFPFVTWGPRLGSTLDDKKRRCTVFDFNHFTRWLRSCNLDIVFFNEERNHDVVRLCKTLGYVTGSYIDYYTPETVPSFFELYDFLVCKTRRHFSVFQNHPHCMYFCWGTDTDLFKSSGRPARKEIRFFHNAGMAPYRKGTDLVVEAFSRVRGRARLIIHTQRRLKSGGVSAHALMDPRIEVITKTVDPPGLYHLGDVYVYPSRLDGIGLTICEALSSGLPTITTNCAPMNEFIAHGENGLLVKVSHYKKRWDGYYWPEAIIDIDDLAAKMQWFVDHPDQLSKFSEIARRLAEERFTWKKNCMSLVDRMSSFSGTDLKMIPSFADRSLWFVHAHAARVRCWIHSCTFGLKDTLSRLRLR